MGKKAKAAAGATVSVLDQIGRLQVILAILGITVPAGLTVMTVVAGIVQRLPSMWVFMAASLVFMATTASTYFLYRLFQFMTSAHKLRYVGTQINRDLSPENRKDRRAAHAGVIAQRFMEKIQVGVLLQNIGHFPISAILVKADTEIEGLTPPRSEYPRPATSILPGNQIFVGDVPIEAGGMTCGRLEGKMDLTIKYGEPGNEKHLLSFKADIAVFMRSDGLVETIHTNWASTEG